MLFETPYADAMQLVGQIKARRDADQRFQAAIHGIDYKASGSSKASGTLRNFHERLKSRIKGR